MLTAGFVYICEMGCFGINSHILVKLRMYDNCCLDLTLQWYSVEVIGISRYYDSVY